MEHTKTGVEPTETCPMSAMCKGMMGGKRFGLGSLLLLIPGVALVVAGILILIEPKVLIWLIAGVLIVVGVMMMIVVVGLRRFGARHRGVGGHVAQGL